MGDGCSVCKHAQGNELCLQLSSVSKNRKLGWHGFVDSAEAILDCIKEMADMKMVPRPIQTKDIKVRHHGD